MAQASDSGDSYVFKIELISPASDPSTGAITINPGDNVTFQFTLTSTTNVISTDEFVNITLLPNYKELKITAYNAAELKKNNMVVANSSYVYGQSVYGLITNTPVGKPFSFSGQWTMGIPADIQPGSYELTDLSSFDVPMDVINNLPGENSPPKSGKLVKWAVVVENKTVTSTPSPSNKPAQSAVPATNTEKPGGNVTGGWAQPSIPEKVVIPVAAVTAGAGISFIGVLFNKIISSIVSYIRGLIQRWVSAFEVRMFGIKANPNKAPVLFNLSLTELAVIAFTILLVGVAFLYADTKLPFIMANLFMFIVISGITWLLHESAHFYFANKYGTSTEFRFWGIGTLAMIVTTLVFGVVFGYPARTMINNMDRLEKRKIAIISLAGPVISLMAAIVFLAIIALGGSLAFIGVNGLPICMVAAVYSLLPIDPMEGKKVWNWNKMIWMAVFIPAIIGYIAMLVYYSMNLM